MQQGLGNGIEFHFHLPFKLDGKCTYAVVEDPVIASGDLFIALFHFLPYGKGGESGQGEDAPTGQMLGSIDDTGHCCEE